MNNLPPANAASTNAPTEAPAAPTVAQKVGPTAPAVTAVTVTAVKPTTISYLICKNKDFKIIITVTMDFHTLSASTIIVSIGVIIISSYSLVLILSKIQFNIVLDKTKNELLNCSQQQIDE
jgi:hypothetical protein